MYSELGPSLYQVEFFIFRQMEVVRTKTRKWCLKSKAQCLPLGAAALSGLTEVLG